MKKNLNPSKFNTLEIYINQILLSIMPNRNNPQAQWLATANTCSQVAGCPVVLWDLSLLGVLIVTKASFSQLAMRVLRTSADNLHPEYVIPSES